MKKPRRPVRSHSALPTSRSRSTSRSEKIITIIPTVFATSKKDFDYKLRRLVKVASQVQIDIMDGKFVGARSIPVEKLPDLRRFSPYFEAHLMVDHPTRILPTLQKKGFTRVIAHIEALKTHARIIEFLETCKGMRMEAGLAINPTTPNKRIEPYLKQASVILFLGVRPGKEGQLFIPTVARRISQFKKRFKNTVQVDGGVNPAVARVLAGVGVSRFNTGSYTSLSSNPSKAIAELKRAARTP